MDASMTANAQHINLLIKQYGWNFGAELGVRRGDFSEYLLKNNPNLHMICVDIWDNDKSLNERHNHKANYQIFLEKTNLLKNRIKILKELTCTAHNKVENTSLDFVFVDATHTYNSVKQDCNLWIPKLKNSGMLCGHDYCEAFDKGGIIRAVNELGKFRIFPRGNSDYCNVHNIINSLSNMENCADLQTGCWFIWKSNISKK